MTRRLGAIFAGGLARRFGGDKAAAEVGGIAMLERVAMALRGQCDVLVVVGRDWAGLPRVGDRPEPGLGPLGALGGALAHAEAEGFAEVLTSGCDLLDLPLDLAEMLAPGPAVVAGQPLLGLWPTTLAAALRHHLGIGRDRSMQGWIAAIGARRVSLPHPIANINTRTELSDYIGSKSPRPAR